MSDAKALSPTGFAAKLAIWTASIVAIAGFIDASTSVLTKSQSIACQLIDAFPWCPDKSGGRTIADFRGDWTNVNPTEAGITRLSIVQRLDKAYVRAWGACHPTNCDWGMAETTASSANKGKLQVTWTTSFKTTQATLTIGTNDRLEVRLKSHFTDQSGRPDFEAADYFKRP